MKNTHYAIAALLCAIPLLLQPTCVKADERVYDPKQSGSITINVVDEQTGAPIPHNADVKLYRVAGPDASGGYLRFNPTGDFAGSGVSLSDMTPDAEINAVNVFLPIVSRNQIVADADGSPNNGSVSFPDLEQGVYLVVYDSMGKTAGGTLVIDPYLLSVPMQNVDGTGWIYNVVSYPKYIIVPDPAPTMTPVPFATPTPYYRPIPGGGGGGYVPYVPPANTPIPQPTDMPEPEPPGAPLVTGAPIQPPMYNQPTATPAPVITKVPDVVIEPPSLPLGPNLPQTGMNRLPVLVMSVLGVMLVFIGWMDAREKRRVKK